MAYSAISSSELNPDSPIVDTLFSRMRDNWIAIKNGESGAPRIRTQAIHPPSNGYNWAWQYSGIIHTSSGVWEELVGGASFGAAVIDVWGVQSPGHMQMWRTGSYYFWINIERTNTTRTASAAVYRNGVRYSAIYTVPVGRASQLFAFPLSLNAGDIISVFGESRDASTVGVLGGMTNRPFAYIG